MSGSSLEGSKPKVNGSDSESNIASNTVVESAQELSGTWPASSTRLPTLHSSSAFDRNASWAPNAPVASDIGRLPTKYEPEDISLIYQKTTSNLFGRSLEDAAIDLFQALRPRRFMGNTTPSLVSDSDSPSPSSPSVTSQISLPRDLASPPESPNSIENRTIPQNMEDEDALVSATQAMGIDPNRKIATAQSTQEPPSLIYVDASNQTLETLPPMPQGSVPATESVASSNTLRTAHSSNSDSSNSEQQAEEDKLNDDTFEPGSEPRHGKQKTSRKLNGQFKCQQCPMTFTRNFDMLRHIKSIHEAQTEDKKLALTCPSCYEVLSRSDAFKRHVVKVPASCVRLSKLLGKERPPAQPESLYDLCRGGHPPLADLLNRPLP